MLLVIVLAFAMTAVVGCGTEEPEPEPAVEVDEPAEEPADEPEEEPAEEPADEPAGDVSNYDLGLIGVSLATLELPFVIAMYEGIETAVADFGANVLVVDNLNDSVKNTSDIEDLMAAGMGALLVMPVDSEAVAPVVQDVMDAGIPVVAVNRRVIGADVNVWIGTDNVEAGIAKAEYFMGVVDDGTRVVILEGTPGAGSGIDRLEGFMSVAGDRLDILASQTGYFNRVDGMEVAENLLVAHPDVEVIVAMNDEMALGAIEAAFAAGRTPGEDILITGFDATDDARAAVTEGTLLFTIEQDPYGMAYKAIEVLLGLMRGETFPEIIRFDIGIVDR